MKSLDQIEARTPIQSLPGDLSDQYVISQPGSYYLTAGITGASGMNCILVSASKVTIDLNGFSLDGGNGQSGIVAVGQKGVVVRNGIFANWAGSAISISGPGARLEKLSFYSCVGGAAFLGTGAHVTDCSVENCGSVTKPALSILNNGHISNCIVHGGGARTNGDGIVVDYGSFVENCVASENGGSGIVANGGLVRIHNCNSSANAANGVLVAGTTYCDISDSTCSENGTSANKNTTAGILLAQSGRADHCVCIGNVGRGIAADAGSANNVVTRCAALANGVTNYAFIAGNRPATIVPYQVAGAYATGDPLANTQ